MPAPLKRTVQFFTEFAEQKDSEELVIPENLSELSNEELAQLSDEALQAFQTIYGDGSNLSVEELETLEALTEGIEALNAETGTRAEADAARAAAAAELAARVTPVEMATEDDEDEDDEGDEDEEELAADTSVEAETSEVVEDSEALVASARPTIRVNMATTRNKLPKEAPATARSFAYAAPETGLFANGESVDFRDMASIVAHKLSGAAGGRMKGNRLQFGIASVSKQFDDAHRIKSDDPFHVESVMDSAADESRLPGGSLVASGGWCAPSETLYDMFDAGESREGILQLPEIAVTRGGINFPKAVAILDSAVTTGLFSFDEDADIEGNYGPGGTEGDKPFYHVECGEWDDVRLQADGAWIVAGLLQARSNPEALADVLRKALLLHDHEIGKKKFAAISAGSTAVTMPSDQVGATAPILSAVELQVEHYRSSHFLSRSATLEAVFPYWVHGAIRSDLSRRLGVDMLSVPDARIAEWFRERGVNPQFVYNDGTSFPGSTAASGYTAWPTSVTFLLYQAGTWVAGSGETIALEAVYDSELLKSNDYTALFTEEQWLVAKRGSDSRKVTVSIDAGGGTHGGVKIDHDGSLGS